MEINCHFRSVSLPSAVTLYTCFIDEANITEKDHVIKRFKGIHEEGKSHKNVKSVCFRRTTVNYFPRGIEKHFPNLTHFTLTGCGINEISRNDLKGLEGISCLMITYSELTSLPDDLFTEMPNLRGFSFEGNKIDFASSELVKPLLGRENVKADLRKNKSIDACFWPGGDYSSLNSLVELMEVIDEKCRKPALQTFVSDQTDLIQNVRKIWTSGKFSDLTIIAGDENFKVHKTILRMQNEVFDQIFEDQSKATEIKIPEFSAKSIEALLKFLYTNEISEEGNAKENFEIAKKFKVAAMTSIYEKIICDQLDETNAWGTFLFAHRVSSQQIKKKAFRLIVQKIPEDLPEELMEDPENLTKLLDYRRGYEEILAKIKPEL